MLHITKTLTNSMPPKGKYGPAIKNNKLANKNRLLASNILVDQNHLRSRFGS